MTPSQQLEGYPEPSTEEATDRIELLRQILSEQLQRNVDYREAHEIGEALMDFYQTLADEAEDEQTG